MSVLLLTIPTADAAVSVTVEPGDTFTTIANAYHISTASLVAANPHVVATNLQIGSVLTVPDTAFNNSTQVTVQPGDTFFTLAIHNQVSMATLMSENPTYPVTNLPIGATINVPKATPPTVPVVHTANSAVTNVTTESRPTTPTTPTPPNSSTSSSNLYWMAHLINAEAGGQSLDAQIAVGDVVLHRLETPGAPSTVKGVVFQVENGHYQFTCVENGYIYQPPTATATAAAEKVLNGHADLVPGAMVFFNSAQTPAGSWVWSQPVLANIGPFTFAK